jgi:hypothetical protein
MRNVFTQLLVAGLLSIASTAAAYNPAIGLKSVYYAGASHCTADSLQSWTCGEACSSTSPLTGVTPIINDAKGTYGFVGYNAHENQIIVSFRGSVNVENWVTNIDFVKTNYKSVPGAQVHEGFYAAYAAVSSEVVAAVKSLLAAHPSASFLFTGHSLGGALATFAGVDVKEQIPTSNPVSMYTFGSPRTGNQAFSDHVFALFGSDGYQRVTHYNDVVPHLPPIPFGFNHAGDEVWYLNSGTDLTFHICNNVKGAPESESCGDSILDTGIEAHLVYIGKTIGSMCTSYQSPENQSLE